MSFSREFSLMITPSMEVDGALNFLPPGVLLFSFSEAPKGRPPVEGNRKNSWQRRKNQIHHRECDTDTDSFG